MRILLLALLLPGCGFHVDVLTDRVSLDAASDTSDLDDAVVFDTSGDASVGIGASVSVGQYHSCSIVRGVLWCWGDGQQGALGVGDETDRLQPTRVDVRPSEFPRPWVEVSAGERHTCARTEQNELFCWGDNASGELGLGDTNRRMTPARVATPRTPKFLSLGYFFTCAVMTDGTLWCWGENVEGQLGVSDAYPGPPSLTPLQVATNSDWTAISGGQGHACGIRAPGSLWCWGRSSDGETGLGDGAPLQVRTPTRVGNADDWIAVDAGQDTTCGLRADGSLWCWGVNAFGQAGQPPSQPITAPRRVGADTGYVGVSTDTFTTCAWKSSGALSCFGRNVEGQLGVGDTTDRSAPTPVTIAGPWAQASVGRFHICARTQLGTIGCAGANDQGQLGTGDTARRNVLTFPN